MLYDPVARMNDLHRSEVTGQQDTSQTGRRTLSRWVVLKLFRHGSATADVFLRMCRRLSASQYAPVPRLYCIEHLLAFRRKIRNIFTKACISGFRERRAALIRPSSISRTEAGPNTR